MRDRTLIPSTLLSRRGQTILEFTLILIIILGVMITMRNYVKRGIQGRWKSAADDVGYQYDPQYVNSYINYATQANAQTIVQVQNGSDNPPGDVPAQWGYWTGRTDTSNTLETKTGFTRVGN